MNQGNNPASFDERQLSRLGLLHPPFANEGFQFEDADIESARNLAVHLLQSSNRLIILSGPPGVGRTTFLRQIAAMHTDELDCCTLVGSPQLRVANIAKMLAMRLGVSEIASDPTTLAARLRQAQASGYRPALLIDDAQRLEENTVKGLLLLREAIAKAGGRLPILLTAPTGTERELLRLTASVADQNELSEIILPAFTEAQTASYLDQSLAAAGEHTGELLSARQKQQIHQQAQGIPAAINRETTRILTEATLKRGPVPTPTPRASSPARRSPRLYAITGAVMVLVAGGLLLARHFSEPGAAAKSEGSVPLALPSRADSGPASSVPTQPDKAGITSPAQPDLKPAPPPSVAPKPGPDSMIAQAPSTEPQQAAPPGNPSTAVPLLRQASPLPPNALDAGRAANPVPEQPEHIADKQANTPPPADESSTAAATTSAEPSASTAPASDQPSGEGMSTTQATAQSAPPAVVPRSHEDWLADRAGNHYTIQLIAGYQQQTLERFLDQHSLGNKAHLVQTEHGGRTWHVLITGDYPSRDAARNALHRLPQELRDNGSWVRSFASLRP